MYVSKERERHFRIAYRIKSLGAVYMLVEYFEGEKPVANSSDYVNGADAPSLYVFHLNTHRGLRII